MHFVLLSRGCDGIFRGATRNKYDFRKGERLGPKEHIVEWKKPKIAEWMSEKEYAGYPSTFKIRELKIDDRIYVTALLNHKKYNRKEMDGLSKMGCRDSHWDLKDHTGNEYFTVQICADD